MRRAILIATALAFSSCATLIPYTYDQTCALKGLKLKGVVSSNSSADSYNYYNGSTSTAISGEAVNCEVPTTEEEKKSIETMRRNLTPIAEYNEKVPSYRTITGVGYVLWILPGIYFYYRYDSDKNLAMNQYEALAHP